LHGFHFVYVAQVDKNIVLYIATFVN